MKESLANKIDRAIPTKRGLFPHELVVLHEATYCEIGNPAGGMAKNVLYFLCGILNDEPYLSNLLERGFLAVGDIADTLEHEFAYTLKAVCANYGLKVSGTKPQLIRRLLTSVDSKKLESAFPRKWYVLTEAGVSELTENAYVGICIKKWLNESTLPNAIWEMNRLIHERPEASFDELWSHMLKAHVAAPLNETAEWKKEATAKLEKFLQKDALLKDRLKQLTIEGADIGRIEAPSVLKIARALKGVIFAEDDWDGEGFLILSEKSGNYIQTETIDENLFVVEFHEQLGTDPLSFVQMQAFVAGKDSGYVPAELVIELFEDFCEGKRILRENVQWKPSEI